MGGSYYLGCGPHSSRHEHYVNTCLTILFTVDYIYSLRYIKYIRPWDCHYIVSHGAYYILLVVIDL